MNKALAVAALLAVSCALATVPVTTSRVEYVGDGVTTGFPFSFPFISKPDIVVTVITSGGVATTKSIGTHYTLTSPSSSGTVTMLTAPASGETLRIERTVPFVQSTAFRAQTTFVAGVHETAFDRATMMAQQLDRRLAIVEDGGVCAPASASNTGCVTTEAQAFAGEKTFSGPLNVGANAQISNGEIYILRIFDYAGGPVDIVGTGSEPRTYVRIASDANATDLTSRIVSFGINYSAGYVEKANINPFGYITSKTPAVLINAYPNAALVAGTTYAGVKLPVGKSEDFTVTQATFRIATAGSGGSTNATIRVSDGTNNCDAAFACNTASGVQSLTPTGTCAFSTNSTLTLSVTSIGNCAGGPNVQNLTVLGNWQ